MGNRAVISFQGSTTGIYLHWNGGPESVMAFIDGAKELGVRDPATYPSYGIARIAQIIGNWFGDRTSIGVDSLAKLDCANGDNGQYVIGTDGVIIARKYLNGSPDYRTPDALPAKLRTKYDTIKAQVIAKNKALFKAYPCRP